MTSTRDEGAEGEEIAVQYLKELGYRILERNYHFGKPEIDIIAMDGGVLVFCEVKMRKSHQFGDPEYAITPRKQQVIRKVANGYFYDHEIKEQECRFDVVAIRIKQGKPDINHIVNAF